MRIRLQAKFTLLFLGSLFGCAGCTLFRPGSNDLATVNGDEFSNSSTRPAGAPTSRTALASFEHSAASFEHSADEGLSIGDFAPKNIGDTYKKLTGRGPNRKAAEQLYREAHEKYASVVNDPRAADGAVAQYEDALLEAAEKFLEAAARWPESTLEEDAMFKAGECYFFANHYVEANDVYEHLIENHKNSRYLDRAEAMRFSIAMYWLKLEKKDPQGFVSYNFFDDQRPTNDTFGNAVRILDKIRIDDPTGRLADDATLAAGNAHFEDGDFERASDFYDDLIRTFPQSEHQFHAHYRGVVAKLETYRGPDYDGKVLDEAEKLLTKIRKQFPREASKHREDLQRAAGIIRYEKAKRDWALGSYYDRRGYNRAARMYYKEIVRQYGDTPFATQARQQLVELADDSDTPADRFSWIVDLFPDPNDKPLVAPQGTIRR